MGRNKVRRGRALWGQPRLESLEARRLLAAVVVQEYQVAGGGLIDSNGIVTGPDGNLWYVQNFIQGGAGPFLVNGGTVGVFNPKTGVSTAISLPEPGGPFNPPPVVTGITVGSDGNVWISNVNGVLESINPTTHAVNSYPIGSIGGLVGVPGGDIWYTDSISGEIGDFSLKTHTATEYPLATTTSDPTAITVGPGGNLWFVEKAASKVGMINPTTHAITEIATPTANQSPTEIVSDGGKLYFSETNQSNVIGIVDPSNNDAISELHLSTDFGPLVAGPDGDLYGLGTGGTLLQSFDPATGAIVPSIIPNATQGFTPPAGLGVGPDGDIWIDLPGSIDQAAIVPAGKGAIMGNVQGTFQTGSTVAYNGPIAGRTVYLDLKGDGTLDPGDPTAVSGSNGWFVFNGVAPGNYTIRLVTYLGETLTGQAGSDPAVSVSAGGVATAPPFGVLSLGTILPLTVSANPFGTHNPDVSTAEVNGLYNIILGRTPDAAGGAAAVAYLKGGGSLQTLTTDLLASAEYQGRVVASYYQNFLGRAGSPAEINAWVAAMQQPGGPTAEVVAAAFLESTEYSALHASNASFVQSLYANILGRPAGTSEVSAWVAAMTGGATRTQVVQAFLGSFEATKRALVGFGEAFFGPTTLDPSTPDSLGTFLAEIFDGASQVDIIPQEINAGTFVSQANATVG
jgi:streptogramin lyase